jgi:hypothetical protein
MVKDESNHSSADPSDNEKPKKVRRGRKTCRVDSSGLEGATMEPPLEKVKHRKNEIRPIGKSIDKGQSDDEKRIETSPGRHVRTSDQIKSNSTALVKKKEVKDFFKNYNVVLDENIYKNLQKKLEIVHDYISIKERGKCWVQELFKAFEYSERSTTIMYNGLAPSTFTNYQYGWGIFADFVLDTECCEHINENECQIVYNNYLV